MAQSYAYDTKGNKVNVTIKDGLSYLDNGNRVGAGYTVQTAGNIYKMGDDGKGYKVDAHNQSQVTNINKAPTTNVIQGNKNDSRTNIVNALSNTTPQKETNTPSIFRDSTPASGVNSYADVNRNNQDIIKAISENHNVDWSVASNMFKSDVNFGTGNNGGMYGDFQITDALRQSMNNADASNMKVVADKYNTSNNKQSKEAPLYTELINKFNEKGTPNQIVKMDNAGYDVNTNLKELLASMLTNNASINPNASQYVEGIEQEVPSIQPNGTPNIVPSNIPISNPNATKNRIVNINGTYQELNDNDYINFMTNKYGF